MRPWLIVTIWLSFLAGCGGVTPYRPPAGDLTAHPLDLAAPSDGTAPDLTKAMVDLAQAPDLAALCPGPCLDPTPVCDPLTRSCVPCTPQNDLCPAGQYCLEQGGDYRCAPGCKRDLDCMGSLCCDHACVDPQSDGKHCGKCGNACVGLSCCAARCVNTAGDAKNCGRCGMACTADPNAHAMVACLQSSCVIQGCVPGWNDCNKNPVDGCESNAQTDAANCGGCGRACDLQGGSGECRLGKCALKACYPGFADCNGDVADGCEVATTADANHCGGCGKRCVPPPNTTATCAAGQCAIGSCQMGFDDCDRNFQNGCEASVGADPKNCGKCGNACNVQNGTGKCQNGACGLNSCFAPFADCNQSYADGCEADLSTTADHCGACGRKCTPPANATAACKGGQCLAGPCNMGFADCNNNPGDGCEANLGSDRAHCGKCGMACPGNQLCRNGQCLFGALRQLQNTHSQNAIRGASTHNGAFADPITGKYYWAPGYTNGKQIWEYNDLATLLIDTNNTRGRLINLVAGYEGTYKAALNGFIYYNIYNTSTMVKVRAADGQVEVQANLAGAGHTNQAAYLWGGYSDICFYVDAGNELYVFWAAPANGQMKVSRLNPDTLALQNTWTVPRAKMQIGFAFLVNGVVYIGYNWSSPKMSATFTLADSSWNANYSNSFTAVPGEYITHAYWNPKTNELYEQSERRVLVYPNAAQ